MIENVEKLSSKLQAHTFREQDPLSQGQIGFCQPRSRQAVAAGVPVRACGRRGEGIAVEIPIGVAQDDLPFKVGS